MEGQGIINLLLDGITSGVAIGRAEDLPYYESPPIQFVYESTATLILGNYVWADGPTTLIPDRPIRENALYFFRNISLAADVSELDFTSAIVTTPQFFTYRESDQDVVLFREPIEMNKFYEQFTYRLWWQTRRGDDQLKAGFTGQLIQTAALIGKDDITLKAVISAQEVVDENFIEVFTSRYPSPPEFVKKASV